MKLQQISSTTNDSASESASLKARIASLESSNRDTLSLLESKTTAYDVLAEELSAQHQKTVELRRQVSTLEQTIQSNSSAAATTRIRIQNLEQELDLSKKNGEWYQSELKAKQEEYMKYRKEKGAKAAELQRINEDINSTVDTLKRTEGTLRNRLAEVEQKFEDSLVSIQQLSEDATKTEENHRLELDRANRLAQLQEKSAATERRRVHEFQEALEQANDGAADEIGRVRAEVETEHSERQAAEERVAELESTVNRLETELLEMQARPQTPVRGMNGNGSNASSRAGTPSRTFSPASSRMKGSMSMTQMYSEYSTMKSQLIKEQRNSEQYKSTLDDMIRDLEALRPEVEGLRSRNATLLEEMNAMSALLDSYSKEKDTARKDARKAETEAHKLTSQRDIYKQQIVDLSAQVRYLIMQNHVLEQGENLTEADIAELERVAQGQIREQDVEGLSDTGRVISERLVVFKNISDLQEKNVQMTNMLRQLSEQMESAESRAKENIYQQEHVELLDLRGQIQGFKDEARSMNLRADGYLKERDMYRRILSKRGHLPNEGDGSSILGQESVPATPTGHRFGSPSSKDVADYTKLIKDLQNHIDAFRQETHTDMQTLKQQNDSLSREKGSLQTDVARANGQLSLAHQRNELLQGNYAMLRHENDTLQKRTQTLMENATKQDFRTQQAVEELVETKSLMDSMRNETSNLKAEKGVWKSVEQRLLEDNENLRNERNRLNTLNGNLQILVNEREQSDTEIRRRQQTTIDNLESELQSTRRKLNDEIEEAKKVSLRKDYDQQQSQKRIDDLMTALGNVREELATAKTTRDHLQAKVDELEIELKSAEEHITALQPKPAAEQGQSQEQQAQDTLTREQELAVEVSELKRDLELAKSEVERAKEQVEQYKNISQDTEEQLESLNEATDQYRQETDRDLAEKDKKVKDLQQRVDDIESELSALNTELSSLQDEKGELTRQISQQKTDFETEIARLKDESEQNALAASYHQENLKAQAEIAQKAQQDYEDELVKHSDATQQLRIVRAQANELRATVVDLRASTESTKTTLAQKEESWAEMRDRYDADLADLRKRREEVQHQNDLLHGQLETIGQQISALKQDRASIANADESDNLDLAALQEVISYLRREKAITEVQYDIVQSDVKRLQRDFDHANAQLDDLRVKMGQEHRRDAESERNALDHSKLVETINELNLYRESSVTLRAEARRAETSLAEKTQLVDDLRLQIQPLEAKVQELENVKETQAGEMKLLQEDRDRWRERTNNIMSKYDRVDPAELESLKAQIQTLTTERDEAVTAKSPLQDLINTLQEQVKESEEKWQGSRAKLVEQFKARSRELSAKIQGGAADLQNAIAEKDALQEQLDASKQSLEDLKVEHSQALAKAAVQPTPLTSPTQPTKSVDIPMENGVEEGQVTEDSTNVASIEQIHLLEETISQLEEKLRTAEAKAEAEAARADALQKEVDDHDVEVEELNRQIVRNPLPNLRYNTNGKLQVELQGGIKTTQDSLNQLLESRAKSSEEGTLEDVSKLRDQLSEKEAEVVNLKAQAAVNSSVASVALEDGVKPIADQIKEQVDAIRTELESNHKARLEELETSYQGRADRMKTQLNKVLNDKKEVWRNEGREATRKELEVEHNEALEKLRTDYRNEVATLNQKHQDELKNIKENEDMRLKQEKAIWMAEQGSSGSQQTSQTSFDVANITEAQARDLVSKNQLIRGILGGNIKTKLASEKEALTNQFNEEKEALTAKLNQDHEKAMEEKVNSTIAMQEGKAKVQQSIANNNKAKLVVVEKAAKETPEKPVAEVWEVAKTAKAQLPGPPPTGPSQPIAAAPASTQASQLPQPGQTQAPAPRGNFGAPTPLAMPTVLQRKDSTSNSTSTASPVQNRAPQPSPGTGSPRRDSGARQGGTQSQSNLPVKPPQGQTNTQPSVRGGPQSQLPRGASAPRGGGRGMQIQGSAQVNQPSPVGQDPSSTFQNALRGRGGGGIPRGGRGGPGQGRGGIPQPQAPGGLNPRANQYVPANGNKRPRDDGQDSSDGNAGKRARGGGGPGN